MLNRWIENGLTRVLDEEGIGCIVFSPLAQGQLTSRYLRDIPADSRAAKGAFLRTDQVRNNLPKIQALSAISEKRGQSLAQMAVAWVLRLPTVTSALLGASSVAQLEENLELSSSWNFQLENSRRSNRSWIRKNNTMRSADLFFSGPQIFTETAKRRISQRQICVYLRNLRILFRRSTQIITETLHFRGPPNLNSLGWLLLRILPD